MHLGLHQRLSWLAQHWSEHVAGVVQREGFYITLTKDRPMSWNYQHRLETLGATTSWSEPGTPADNTRVESFHSLFKREFVRGRIFPTRAQAISEATRWLRFYQRYRYHSSLGDLSPAEFERHNAPQ